MIIILIICQNLPTMNRLALLLTAGSMLLLPACQQSQPQPTAGLSPMAALGKQLFSDPALSASGRQSCASCHDPQHGFGPANSDAVQPGGPGLDRPGLRNTPMLTYVRFVPAPSVRADGAVTGGFFWDGRAATLTEQAQGPLLNPFEMANSSAEAVVQTLQRAPYRQALLAVFGDDALSQPEAALRHVGEAIAAFEREAPELQRFDSKFDAVQAGKARFTAQEQRGFALFNAPDRGNCAACHVSSSSQGIPALFTDYSYDNLGLPRNWAIPANTDPSPAYYGLPENGTALGEPYRYYDMGLCGPITASPASSRHCGQFRVPSLRNVAMRGAYFHNGVIHSLQDAVDFYMTRDTDPSRWFVHADQTPDDPYNDLPQAYASTINHDEAPYNPRLTPRLTLQDRMALVAFLCTLSDGFDPANPGAYTAINAVTNPRQCQIARQN